MKIVLMQNFMSLIYLKRINNKFRRLVERLQNMRNNAAGDGISNCILCGETFSFFTRNVKFYVNIYL